MEYRNQLPQSLRVRASNRGETQNRSKLRNSALNSSLPRTYLLHLSNAPFSADSDKRERISGWWTCEHQPLHLTKRKFRWAALDCGPEGQSGGFKAKHWQFALLSFSSAHSQSNARSCLPERRRALSASLRNNSGVLHDRYAATTDRQSQRRAY